MLQRLRHRVQGQEGFTLIELLVVILIIGILAAVAIPTFLSQTSKAKDSNLQSALSTAQTTEATYQTSNDGYATGLTAADNDSTSNALIKIEPSLKSPWGTYSMQVLAPADTKDNVTNGFTVEGVGSDGVTYDLTYDGDTGQVYKDCDTPNKGACNANSQW